ncbi:hypothetical protein HELRODRAFT_164619 [Helobdella robusta]|uniref:SIPAR domain-containing protein n=1 Tax=Helobdella robusta TaxID=6412 RepID=T1EVN3_HELRO|nr:hypothetical protein HELRODRAFT_164619 [Helobdella robusta]ESN92550.1 hypothetical protein HELRODRAFT_164619 [Helobdella robusta]
MHRNLKDLREFICVSRLTVQDSDEEHADITNYYKDTNDDGNNLSTRNSFLHSPDSGIQSLTRNDPTDVDVENVGVRDRTNVKKSIQKSRFYAPSKSSNNTRLPKITTTKKNHVEAQSSGVQYTDVDSTLKYLDSNVVAGWLTSCNDEIHKLTNWLASISNFCNFVSFWLSECKKEDKKCLIQMEHDIIMDEISFAFSSGVNSKTISKHQTAYLLKQIFHEYPDKLLSNNKHNNLFIDYLVTLTSKNKSLYKKLLSDVKCRSSVKQYIQDILAMRCFCLINLWSGVVSFFHQLQMTENEKERRTRKRNDGKKTYNFDAGGSSDDGEEDDLAHGKHKKHHTSKKIGNEPSNRNKTHMLPMRKDHKNLLLSDEQLNVARLFSAVKSSLWDVVLYMLNTKKVSLYYKDERRKSLFFHAVTMNNCQFLKILLHLLFEDFKFEEALFDGANKVNYDENGDDDDDIVSEKQRAGQRDDTNRVGCWQMILNECADNGNSPLHAACNMGSTACVRALLTESRGYVHVDLQNKMCDGATPLHLAVMHGQREIVQLLLSHGANVNAKMSDMDALQVARSFCTNNKEHQQQREECMEAQTRCQIIELLEEEATGHK